jgi:hypothetical protein
MEGKKRRDSMRFVISLICSVLLMNCMVGPEGRDGKDGVDGKDITVYNSTGILYSTDQTAETGKMSYWDVTNYNIAEKSIVQVYVRQGSGFMWVTPLWYLSSSYVRIFDNDLVDPGYEYKIVVSK